MGQQGSCCTRNRAILMRSVAMEWGLWRWARTLRSPRPELGGYRGGASPKMADVGWGGQPAPFRHQEAICGNAQGGVVVKSPPVAAFVVSQPEFPFEFLIIALDHPAMLADPDQPFQGEVRRQTRQPVATWLLGSDGPLHQ